ncbi:MAG: ATP-grasp domain-containing protein [Desulfobacterales bacterium]|nr:ATP-grasp domain-containing protein [Desulfobacterales bacterium]MBF0398758.1 ATP-grasp domain-containing protein [Desulfobacterales bacterium]
MIAVAVSGINAVDNPGPGTGIIRSLKESSIEVKTIGLAYDAMEPGAYMGNIVDKAYIMPYPSGSKRSFIERINYIHQIEKLDVIISALDAELPVFIDIVEDLKHIGINMLIPTKQMFQLRDKTKLSGLAKNIGIKSPNDIACSSYGEFFSASDQIGYPCMIKGPFYEAFKATTFAEAENFFYKLVNKWGYPIIVQQYIFGDEYDVIGCGDGKGNDLGLFAIKKMTTTSLGKVWNAVSISNPRLFDAAKKFVSNLSWRGGFELEALIEEKTQEIYLLEINPRFPAWVYMSSACGINLPERMVRFLMNMPYENHSNYKSGKIMIRYTTELMKDISDFEKLTSFGELEHKKEKKTNG